VPTATLILTTRPQRRNHLLPRSPAPLPTSPCSPCAYVEISLHSRVFSFAKRTQFVQGQTQRNFLYTLSFRPKARYQRAEAEESASILTPPPKSPIWPNLPRNHDLYYAKQSQFPKRQNQRNLLCRKGLRKQTTPARFEKTNPIKPNSTAPLLRRERIQNLGAKRISRFIGPASKIENPVSRIQYRESSIENPVSRIQLHYAKQTQFQNGQYDHKYSNTKGLCQ